MGRVVVRFLGAALLALKLRIFKEVTPGLSEVEEGRGEKSS